MKIRLAALAGVAALALGKRALEQRDMLASWRQKTAAEPPSKRQPNCCLVV